MQNFTHLLFGQAAFGNFLTIVKLQNLLRDNTAILHIQQPTSVVSNAY